MSDFSTHACYDCHMALYIEQETQVSRTSKFTNIIRPTASINTRKHYTYYLASSSNIHPTIYTGAKGWVVQISINIVLLESLVGNVYKNEIYVGILYEIYVRNLSV